MSKPRKPRIATNGYRLCDPLPKGEVLTDNTGKHEWILGVPIGQGGFGEIYSCRRKGDRTDDYVMKLDHKDGPLFSEFNFYVRVAKEDQIKDFMAKHNLKFLGMPRFVACGLHDKPSGKKTAQGHSQHRSNRNAATVHYRFLIMKRFGDLLEDYVHKKKLTAADAAEVASQMIDVLEYIHSFGYIHADIKATNILKSMSKSKSNEWYLVDFGNADKYLNPDGSHREEKADKKRANNGTVEFRSRDAHIGLISRRSDIECLAFNLIQWLYGQLPWMGFLADADKVEDAKKKFMANVGQSLNKCFARSVPNGLKEFLLEVSRIRFQDKPDYSLLKQLLTKVAKNRTNILEVDDNEENEPRKKKNYSSESESVIESVRMNSPVRNPKPSERNLRSPAQRSDAKLKKNVKSRRVRREWSDSEESDDSDCIEIISSPPKRSRTQLNTRPVQEINRRVSPRAKPIQSPVESPDRPLRSIRPKRSPIQSPDRPVRSRKPIQSPLESPDRPVRSRKPIQSPIESPDRPLRSHRPIKSPLRSKDRPVRSCRPSIIPIYDTDMDQTSDEDSDYQTKSGYSDVELSRSDGPTETPAMKAMRELIAKKKNAKTNKRANKKTK